MPPEDTTAVKPTLEKPLNELTEDDIAQLTREDCRRYLKEKGTTFYKITWEQNQQGKSDADCLFRCRNEKTFLEQMSGDSASHNAQGAPRNVDGFRRWFLPEAPP